MKKTTKDSIAILGLTYGSCLNIEAVNHGCCDSLSVYYSYYDSNDRLIQGDTYDCEIYYTDDDSSAIFDYRGEQYRLDDFLVTQAFKF